MISLHSAYMICCLHDFTCSRQRNGWAICVEGSQLERISIQFSNIIQCLKSTKTWLWKLIVEFQKPQNYFVFFNVWNNAGTLLTINVQFRNLMSSAEVLSLNVFTQCMCRDNGFRLACSLLYSCHMHCLNASSLHYISQELGNKFAQFQYILNSPCSFVSPQFYFTCTV